MFSKLKLHILTALILLPSFLFAGEVLTLEEAIDELVASNPEIDAAGFRTEAARARIGRAKALDDPMIGVMFEEVPIDTANINRGDAINYRIEQKIPFPGKRHIRGKAARFDAEAVASGASGDIQDVLLDLKRTYYDLYRIDRQIEVNRENQGLLRQMLGSAETGYASGKTTADAPLKARVELSELQNEAILLEQEKVTQLSRLTALLDRPPYEEIRIPTRLPRPRLPLKREEVLETALGSRPELKEIDAVQKRDKANLTKARQSLLPDFSLGLEYNQRPNRQDAWSGTAMINLPIFFWGKNRSEIREAKANLKATEAAQRSLQRHTTHDIDQAYSAFRAAEKLVGTYQGGILPQAKTTLESARVAYAAGQVDFLTLIDAARTYRNLKMSFYETQARVGVTFAELERLVGTDLLEHKGVNHEK